MNKKERKIKKKEPNTIVRIISARLLAAMKRELEKMEEEIQIFNP